MSSEIRLLRAIGTLIEQQADEIRGLQRKIYQIEAEEEELTRLNNKLIKTVQAYVTNLSNMSKRDETTTSWCKPEDGEIL